MPNQGIPKGAHTITPNTIVRSVDAAVLFYTEVFGAIEIMRLKTPDGKTVHCELRFGDSRVNLGESMEGWPEQAMLAQIYVPNSDATFALALKKGAVELSPVTDMFFGAREGRIKDPFGNTWTISTHHKDVSAQEMQRQLNTMYGG